VVDDSEFKGFIGPCGQGGIPTLMGQDTLEQRASMIIPLRCMYDAGDGLAYGSIEITHENATGPEVKIHLKNGGHVELYAAKSIQDQFRPLFSGKFHAGTHQQQLDLCKYDTGQYYLLLFFEGKLAHFQELDLRR
jgi:hypothetical protein